MAMRRFARKFSSSPEFQPHQNVDLERYIGDSMKLLTAVAGIATGAVAITNHLNKESTKGLESRLDALDVKQATVVFLVNDVNKDQVSIKSDMRAFDKKVAGLDKKVEVFDSKFNKLQTSLDSLHRKVDDVVDSSGKK